MLVPADEGLCLLAAQPPAFRMSIQGDQGLCSWGRLAAHKPKMLFFLKTDLFQVLTNLQISRN